jgi:hypothetical protein
VAVAGVFAEADVDGDEDAREELADELDSENDRRLGRGGVRASRVLVE